MIKLAILALLFGITMARPRWSLYLVLLASPLLAVYQSVGWDLRLWLAYFLGMRAILTTGGHVRSNVKLIAAAGLFFVIAGVVLQLRSSIVPPDDASSAQQAFLYLFAGAMFAFAASQLLQNTAHFRWALTCVAIAVSYTTGYALWERFFASAEAQLRIGSTLINPNSLGAYASLCALTLLISRRMIDSRSWRFVIWAGTLLSVTGVVLSLSRASILALTAGLIALWATRDNTMTLRRALTAVTGSVVLMAVLVTAIRNIRVSAGGADATKQRGTEIAQSMEDLTRYEAATYSLKQWREHPFFGVGFMLFPGINYKDTGFFATTHNTILELLVGTGVVGIVLAAFIALQLWKNLSKSARLGLVPPVVAFLINALFGDYAQALELTAVLAIAYLVAEHIGSNIIVAPQQTQSSLR